MSDKARIELNVVSAEQELFSEKVEMVFAPAALGEVGITPGHTPFLSIMQPGNVRAIRANGEEEVIYVSGGILEVQPYMVTVLSDTAERAHDLDEATALAACERAQAALANKIGEVEYSKVLADLAQATAQVRAIKKLRRKR